MSNKDYYELWLKLKEQFNQVVLEDERIQEMAIHEIGVKPQAAAVEIVARVYCKYCKIFNQLCECYDQMQQVQRRPYIKKIIDAVTCRILELKSALEEIEVFEFIYPENALQQLLMVPDDIHVLCPFFYSFETREEEMQYIVDQIMAGNRIGDPKPTPSEVERREEERLAEEERKREEKEAEIKRKLAMGEDIIESVREEVLSPAEIEEMRLRLEYEGHINNIQRMERSRKTMREKAHKINKDANLYLELTGLKKPPAREETRIKAAQLIQSSYRKFMELKREHFREYKLRVKIGMVMPSYKPPSVKMKLEDVKKTRREFTRRRKYHQQWIEESVKENSRILRLREGDIMEDISAEIRQWFAEWYNEVRVFDEFPWPDEGGTVLVVTGRTFTIEEYIEWRTAEEKRLKAEASAPKSKDQIKAEKLAAKAEKKRLALDAKEKEKKRLLDYKKSRLNPDNDPGIYITIGKMVEPVIGAWATYQSQWKHFDFTDAPLNVLKGFIKEIITETAYQDIQLQLRKIVDDVMRLELKLLQKALKIDLANAEVLNPPLTKKRRKPKKVKPPKRDRVSPAAMFQALVDQGIVRKYPRITLDDYWGDVNYAAADLRAVMWTPSFPPPGIGDIREQVRTRCLLTSGCNCPNATRTQLIVGPKSSGKRSLVYAIATETNSILIDLSPFNVYNKFPGQLKQMFTFVTRISKLMQPTVIMVDNADKLFYKKVPKEEKMFDPTKLSKDFYKEVVKPISFRDKILVLGTATEPWLAKNALMCKAFPSLILIPRTDYGSLSLILSKMMMEYHGVQRDFNVHSAAQVLRGYNISSVKKATEDTLNGNRVVALYHKPLDPVEIIEAVVESNTTVFTSAMDYEMFTEWYLSYSPWGQKYIDYMLMLESQLVYKLKADEKRKKKAG